jgi:hypothetical protein
LPDALGETLCRSIGLTNVINRDLNTVSAMLTSDQSAVLMKALESADGADVLSAAPVTTLSGRQAQIQVVDLNTAATNQNPQALTAQGIFPPPGGTKSLQRTGTIPFGPTMDVVAWASPDARWIELVVNVTYVGYENLPGSALPSSPHVQFGQATGTAFLQNGQTLLLETMLKDEPGSESAAQEFQKKRLLVLLTPRIVNPGQETRGGQVLSPEPLPR